MYGSPPKKMFFGIFVLRIRIGYKKTRFPNFQPNRKLPIFEFPYNIQFFEESGRKQGSPKNVYQIVFSEGRIFHIAKTDRIKKELTVDCSSRDSVQNNCITKCFEMITKLRKRHIKMYKLSDSSNLPCPMAYA